MSVVDVDSVLLGKILKGGVIPEVPCNDILYRGGDKEILLTQPEALALGVIVGGVEHLADDLRHSLLLHGSHVIALVEHCHVDAVDLRRPQTQHCNASAVLAGHHHIIGDCLDGLAADKLDLVEVVIPAVLDLALELDLNGLILSGHEPYFAAGEPEIGHLRLPAVDYLLLENAVFIEYRVAHASVALICQGVKVAGGKPAQTAVAETRIRLAVIELIELHAEAVKGLPCGLGHVEIVESVFEASAHEELHAEVINLLLPRFLRLRVEIPADVPDHISRNYREHTVELVVGRVLRLNAENMRELGSDKLLERLLCDVVIHTILRKETVSQITYLISLHQKSQ